MWMTSCTGSARRILGDLKKSVELRTRLRTGRVDFRGSLRPNKFMRYGCHTCWGCRWKSQIRKNVVSLSLCRRTFKLKGNKRFRTWAEKSWTREEVPFFMFRDSYILCIYVMNILCTFHISISGYAKVKTIIQVSYLNYRESSVFRDSYA